MSEKDRVSERVSEWERKIKVEKERTETILVVLSMIQWTTTQGNERRSIRTYMVDGWMGGSDR